MTASHIQAPNRPPIKSHRFPSIHPIFHAVTSLCIVGYVTKFLSVTGLPVIEAFGHFFFAVLAVPFGCEVY